MKTFKMTKTVTVFESIEDIIKHPRVKSTYVTDIDDCNGSHKKIDVMLYPSGNRVTGFVASYDFPICVDIHRKSDGTYAAEVISCGDANYCEPTQE